MGIISEARRAANRANARKSTGPKTPAGKRAVRLNALKHGLAGATAVLADEDRAAFDRLLADYERRFAPRNEGERTEVRQLAEARWRLGRGMKVETVTLQALIDKEAADGLSPDEVLSLPGLLLRISRYEGQIQRAYDRALERLRLLKALDAAAAEPAPPAWKGEGPAERGGAGQGASAGAAPSPASPSRSAALPPRAAGGFPQFAADNGFVSSPPSPSLKARLLASCDAVALLAGAPSAPWRFTASPPGATLPDAPAELPRAA